MSTPRGEYIVLDIRGMDRLGFPAACEKAKQMLNLAAEVVRAQDAGERWSCTARDPDGVAVLDLRHSEASPDEPIATGCMRLALNTGALGPDGRRPNRLAYLLQQAALKVQDGRLAFDIALRNLPTPARTIGSVTFVPRTDWLPACMDAHLLALARLFQRHTFRFANETALHDALGTLLTEAGYTFTREHRFDAKNRADFFLSALGVVIEVKVDGTLSHALHQVARYSTLDGVRGVLLVAATAWSGTLVEDLPELHGRAFHMAHLQRRFL